MRSLRCSAPDQRGRRLPAQPVALVRPLGVVVAHETVEGALQCRTTGEVATPESHTPQFLQNGALQPFDEAVGPSMAGFRPRVPQAELPTSRIKRALKLGTAVGEDAVDDPARALEVHDELAQE